MASSYVNDLRLNEMATGDASGTWGTVTNTNLELIGEALGFGTEAITTNADTHTSTVADGATDPVRAMFVKYTGTLDSACTITIAPNDMKRMQFIENGTSGSQNIIISQGSGANVTIPPGDTKAVYLNGAGSGAAVIDAFASLSVVDLKVQDDLTVTDDATIGGRVIIDDTTDATSTTDGSLQTDGGLSVAKDTIIGNDLKLLSDSAVLVFGAGSDATLTHTNDVGLTLNGTNKLMFNDASQFIQGASATVLDIAATDEIELTATLIDVVGNQTVSGTLGVTGVLTGTSLDISGDIDVDGTTNLDVVDIDGAVDMASTLTVGGAFTSLGIDDNANAVAITIDSSENVLVGKTDQTANVAGTEIEESGTIVSTRASNTNLFLNRTGNDGDLINFRKDNSTVGTIGTSGGASFYGGPSGGLMFNGVNINPTNGTATRVDNANDIGAASYRFKDLYLSGGAFIGGTGTVNKLDDYEEGTWTPTIFGSTTAGTYSLESIRTGGKYTKVGNLVTIDAVLRISSIDSAGAGSLSFGGLPFGAGTKLAAAWHSGQGVQVTHYGAGAQSSADSLPPPFVAAMAENATTFAVQSFGKNYQITSNIQTLSANAWIYQIAGTYHTNT